MRADGILRRLDDFGRIVIPKELRMQIFGTHKTEGMLMEVFMDKDTIVLRKYEENKDDDVCEWKLTDTKNLMPYKTACGNEDLYDSHYKYCPYCSKKIKVVE